MTEHANTEPDHEGHGLRRGWRLNDDADDEVPEGFTWTWRPEEESSVPSAESGGPVGAAPVHGATRTEINLVSTEDVDYHYDDGPLLPNVGSTYGQAPQYQSLQNQSLQSQGPQFQAPQFQAPQFQAPQFQDAQFQDGQYAVPEFRAPEPQATQYEVPQLPVPPLPADIATFPVSRETDGETELDTPIAREAEAAIAAMSRSTQPVPRPANTRVFVVANQKGGVGKTTTTVNIAASLAQFGAKVLVVDLDPQGNASTALGIDHHAEVPSVYDVLIERHEMDEVVCPVPDIEGLYCVPATIDLAGAEIELVSMVARESRLKRALESCHQKMDYIFIDCPPSLGLLTVNALVAGSEVLIPIQCEYYALEGLGQLLRNIDLVRGHLNPSLHVSTLLLTMYDARTRLAAQVADEVRMHFPNEVLNTAVPRSVRISEAPSYSQTVMTYDPASSGALAYREAAREIAERGAGPTIPESRNHDGRMVEAAHAAVANTSSTMNEVTR